MAVIPMQAAVDENGVTDRDGVLRRLVPDAVQLQVIVGCLLGDAQLVGAPGARRLVVAHAADRARYAWWKYERLGAFAADAPVTDRATTTLRTIAHPLFDDLATVSRGRLVELAGPLALAVWLTDLGRLELSFDAFLPDQRAALCAA